MTIQEAIQKAVEGGYSVKPGTEFDVKIGIYFREDGRSVGTQTMLLDPLFWQALGKSMGWVNTETPPNWSTISDQLAVAVWLPEKSWWYYMYGLINALIHGKTVEDYFANL